MDEFIKKLQEKCPNWNIKEIDEGLEIGQYTDAGEDFSFEAEGSTPKELADSIYNYYQGFDPEEHVKMWIEAEKDGVKGVPNLFVLVEDSKKLDEDLEDLGVHAVRVAEEIENENNKNQEKVEDEKNPQLDEKLIKKLEKEIEDFKNEYKTLNESNAYDLVLYDTAYHYIIDKIDNGELENKDLEKILKKENILETVREYDEDTVISNFDESIKIATDEVLHDILNSSEEVELSNNISSNFNNLLNFINNNENDRTEFNNAKNGMFVNKDDNTNVVLFVKYNEDDLGDRETFIFGNEDNVTKYLTSLKNMADEYFTSDGLTEEDNKKQIKFYKEEIEAVLEDLRVSYRETDEICMIKEDDNGFKLSVPNELNEKLEKITEEVSSFVNGNTKQKSIEEEM